MIAARAPDASSDAADLLDELPDGVIVTTIGGLIERANLAFFELTCRGVEEVVGRPMESIVAEEDAVHLLGFEAVFGAAAVPESVVIFTSADGRHFPLTASSNISKHRNRVLLTLRASGALHRELADTSRWAAVEQDRAHALAEAHEKLAAKNSALSAAQEEIEVAYARLQGEVTARERLEEELRLSQKLEAIGQLAAGIAHEINTPMQYVGDNVGFLMRAFDCLQKYVTAVGENLASHDTPEMLQVQSELETLRRKLKLDFLAAQVPRALGASKAGIENVSNIVRAMKAFAHVDQGEKTLCDVNQAISDTLMVAQGEYKAIASVEMQLTELPLVSCFPGKLNQVLLNLIVNAAHAIADAKRPMLGTIRVGSSLDGDVVSITVSDDGCGIPEQIQHKIFDQFFTTKAVGRGTGQGLSLVRKIIIDVHGGTVSFRSQVGVGTTFTLRLPVDGCTKLAMV